MTTPLIERFLAAARQETALSLQSLCDEIGAAESSVLLPEGEHLRFFASTNPILPRPTTPRTPIGASFSGAAFRSGQTLAVADAAGKAQHFGAVDAATKTETHEFAAIPIVDREVLGVLTLVNRSSASGQPKPFDLNELRRAETFARELAPALRWVARLLGAGGAQGADDAADAELHAALAPLNPAERRIVALLASALVENRGR